MRALAALWADESAFPQHVIMQTTATGRVNTDFPLSVADRSRRCARRSIRRWRRSQAWAEALAKKSAIRDAQGLVAALPMPATRQEPRRSCCAMGRATITACTRPLGPLVFPLQATILLSAARTRFLPRRVPAGRAAPAHSVDRQWCRLASDAVISPSTRAGGAAAVASIAPRSATA